MDLRTLTYAGQVVVYAPKNGEPRFGIYLGQKDRYDHIILLLDTYTTLGFFTDYQYQEACRKAVVADKTTPTGRRIYYGPECRKIVVRKFSIKIPSKERCAEIITAINKEHVI